MSRSQSLFISHSWSYSDSYERLVGLLDDVPGFHYKNYSIPKSDPIHDAKNQQELYAAIKRKMSPCDVVVMVAGVYATYSKWIEHEITIAKGDFSKPIVAVKPWANKRVSTAVSSNADVLVNWSADSIVSAVRELSS